NRKASARIFVGDACLFADVGEGSVSIIMVKEMLGSVILFRRTSDRDSLHFAGAVDVWRRTIFLVVKVGKVANVKIEVTIVVDVTKGSAHAPFGELPLGISHPSLFSNLSESSVSIVAIKLVGSKIGHIEIKVPIVVIISNSHSAAPFGIA